jgi:hypothetical protein
MLGDLMTGGFGDRGIEKEGKIKLWKAEIEKYVLARARITQSPNH